MFTNRTNLCHSCMIFVLQITNNLIRGLNTKFGRGNQRESPILLVSLIRSPNTPIGTIRMIFVTVASRSYNAGYSY